MFVSEFMLLALQLWDEIHQIVVRTLSGYSYLFQQLSV
jgi:hypothetical protein